MQLILGLFLVVVSVSVSADLDLDSQMFKGKAAQGEDLPYNVGLYLIFKIIKISVHYCGGSLISETFILTAAHCLKDAEIKDITTFLGSIYLERGTERRPRKMIIHNEYEKYSTINDIGLLEIDSISYSDTIKAINLPPLSDLNATYQGHIAIASGWGRTSEPPRHPDVLHFAHLLVISNTACAKLHSNGTITKEVICVADPNGSACCRGDTGGPLVDMDSENLIGIVSFGPTDDCNTIHFGTVYTRVTSHREWIFDHTGI